MIEFLLGIVAGILVMCVINQHISNDQWTLGNKAGIEWATAYWESKIKRMEQQRIREWLK